jgi:uncharacterized membrane protein YraQ (UPF0718 family)
MRSLLQILRGHWITLAIIGLYFWAYKVDPGKTWQALERGMGVFVSALPIIIAVFGLVGLTQAWISRERVSQMVGQESGWSGLLLAALCGTILIGPAYIIFPLLMSLHQQGARWAVIATVLAAYTVKIPMIPLEVLFLGWKFSLVRGVLTLLLAIPMGLLLEKLMIRRTLH